LSGDAPTPWEEAADWAGIAEALVDALCDAPDQATAVDRVLAELRPVEYRGDVMWLGRELSRLRSRAVGSERKVACSALAQCLYRNVAPMHPPLATGFAAAALLLLATVVALVAGQATIALVLALPLAAALARIGLFEVRTRRADPAEPARLPDRVQLLALPSMRSLPPGPLGATLEGTENGKAR
jgi:hypothetical protein